jgi:hypothetical protein
MFKVFSLIIDERSEGRGRACSDMTERVRSKKGLIPRGLPRKTPSGVGCRACPAVLILFIFISLFSGCRRQAEELPVMPAATHPLVREYVGYGVVNVSFTHLLTEPDPAGTSKGYLRLGTVVRVIERRQIIKKESQESWVLAEGNSIQGWLQETTVNIFDNESRAITASKAMSQ